MQKGFPQTLQPCRCVSGRHPRASGRATSPFGVTLSIARPPRPSRSTACVLQMGNNRCFLLFPIIGFIPSRPSPRAAHRLLDRLLDAHPPVRQEGGSMGRWERYGAYRATPHPRYCRTRLLPAIRSPIRPRPAPMACTLKTCAFSSGPSVSFLVHTSLVFTTPSPAPPGEVMVVNEDLWEPVSWWAAGRGWKGGGTKPV